MAAETSSPAKTIAASSAEAKAQERAVGYGRPGDRDEQLALLAERSRRVLGIAPGMKALLSAPMYHSAPVTYAVQAALVDAHLWIEPKFDAERTLLNASGADALCRNVTPQDEK